MADTIVITTNTPTVLEISGKQGPQGPAGATGATGATGPQGPAGTGIETLTTAGDLLYRDNSAAARLPIGTSGQVLKVSSGGLPEWGAAAASGVTSVTGTAPIASSGGNTPAISISEATTSAAGSMSAADKTKLDGIAAGAEVNVNADWNASSGDAQILNKPTLGGAAALNVGTTTGTVAAGDDARLSDSRTPTAHAASHAAGQADQILPSDIGAQSLFTTTTLSITADTNLSATRATIYNVSVGSAGSWKLIPATTGSIAGDVIIVFHQPIGFGNALTFTNGLSPSGIQTIAQNERYRFVYSGSVWQADPVYTHTHAASAIISGTLTHERGGLEADVSAYSGLVKISGGSTSAVTVTAAGEALLDDATNADQRTTLGLGTAAVANLGTGATDAAYGNHTHTQLHDKSHSMTDATSHTAGNHKIFYSDGSGNIQELALGANDTFLKSNGATSAPSFAAASGGVSAIGASAADILSVSGSDLVADDPNADRLVMFDDSEGKLVYATLGTGLSFSGSTINASGGASIMQSIAVGFVLN